MRHQTHPPSAITARQYGVGARFTLSVYDSGYAGIILGALEASDTAGLVIETGDISTYVAGDEAKVLRFLRDVIAAAAGSGAHLSASILLSRGCPGELTCELPPGTTAVGADSVTLEPTGVHARAHWSLYPLLDGGAVGIDHMGPIYAAIERARASGVFSGSDHYATRLAGDLAQVLATVANAWIEIGSAVQHVTTHVTVSVNSPTRIED